LRSLSYHVSKDCFHGKLGGEEIGVRAPPPDGVAFASDAETPLIRERAGAAAAGSDDDAAAGEARSALPALDDPRRSAPPSQPLAWYMREAWIYAVPAAFYLVDNNVVFSIMKYIDPATALLFSNGALARARVCVSVSCSRRRVAFSRSRISRRAVRIVFTAFLYRVFLGRLLSSLQWAALLLLLVGMLISGNSGGAPNSDGERLRLRRGRPRGLTRTPRAVLGLHGAVLIGFGFVCIASFSASFGNIFTEYIYKRRKGGSRAVCRAAPPSPALQAKTSTSRTCCCTRGARCSTLWRSGCTTARACTGRASFRASATRRTRSSSSTPCRASPLPLSSSGPTTSCTW
jgi:hypothetical protein